MCNKLETIEVRYIYVCTYMGVGERKPWRIKFMACNTDLVDVEKSVPGRPIMVRGTVEEDAECKPSNNDEVKSTCV